MCARASIWKIGLILITLSLFTFGIKTVNADVPSIIDIVVTVEPNGRTLTITVRHNSPSNIHYVSKMEVKVGEDIIVVELDPQSSSAFTGEIDITTGDVQVRAYCTLHGWSSWASLEDDSDPVPEPSSGIPGFPVLAVGIGITGFMLRRRDW